MKKAKASKVRIIPVPEHQTALLAERTERRKIVIVGLTIALVTFVALSRILYNEFVDYDDELYVTENPMVLSGLSAQSLYYALTGVCAANWHPLTMLSHILDCTIFGVTPAGHHLTSLLLHAANTFLLFFVLRHMTGALWPSAVVALLFGIHPLHVVSVAHVAQRKDVLSTFFWILTMLAYAKYVETRNTKAYAFSLASYTCGLLAKPMLVSLPLVLLCLDYWPLRRYDTDASARKVRMIRVRALIREKLPFFALAFAISAITFVVQRASGTVSSLDARPFTLRVQNAIVSYALYLVKCVWPSGLSPFYPYPQSFALWKLIGAALVFAIATALAIASYKRRPYITLGWFWYVVTLVPVIGIVQVGAQAMADRYTYVPLIGIFVIAAWGLDEIIRLMPRSRVPMMAASSLVAAAFIVATWTYAGTWLNRRTLWEHALDVTTDNPVANCNLGLQLVREGDLDGAARCFQEALRITPTFADAQRNLANTYVLYVSRYMEEGRYDNAIASFSKALALESSDPEIYAALGHTHFAAKNYAEAVRAYAEALRLGSDRVDVRYNSGVSLEATGRLDDARRAYEDALRIRPGYQPAQTALERLGKKISTDEPPGGV